ncbi:MAG: hypothetical protein MZW92_51415 [Comamonadaceae bacterium]|nr:hypothetical protein [Comamonadaceae bacterium]
MIFADQLMYTGFALRDPRRHVDRHRRHADPDAEGRDHRRSAEREVKEIEQQYTSGLVTQGERYNKVVDIWVARRRPGRQGDDGQARRARTSTTPTARRPRRSRSTRST